MHFSVLQWSVNKKTTSKATDLFWRIREEIRGRSRKRTSPVSAVFLCHLSADTASMLATVERLVFLYM